MWQIYTTVLFFISPTNCLFSCRIGFVTQYVSFWPRSWNFSPAKENKPSGCMYISIHARWIKQYFCSDSRRRRQTFFVCLYSKRGGRELMVLECGAEGKFFFSSSRLCFLMTKTWRWGLTQLTCHPFSGEILANTNCLVTAEQIKSDDAGRVFSSHLFACDYRVLFQFFCVILANYSPTSL